MVITIPIKVVKAIVPILGFKIIITPHVIEIIEHINIYSKKLGFRVHLFLVNTKGNQICEIIMKLSL